MYSAGSLILTPRSLDVHRAGVHARVAGGARPDRFRSEAVDDALLGGSARQQDGGVLVGVVTQVVDDLHRVERLAGCVGRADVLAAEAGGAHPAVEQRAPTVLRIRTYTELLDVKVVQRNRLAFIVNGERAHLAGRFSVMEDHGRQCRHQMHVLAGGDRHEEAGDEHHVQPITAGGKPRPAPTCLRPCAPR